MIKMLVCDFDGTISGGHSSGIDKLNHHITHHSPLHFVVATGRTFPSIQQGLLADNFPLPSTIISDVGTQIHHVGNNASNSEWSRFVSRKWQKEKIQDAIAGLSFIGKQSDNHQSQHKITIEGRLDPSEFQTLQHLVTQAELEVDLTYSHD